MAFIKTNLIETDYPDFLLNGLKLSSMRRPTKETYKYWNCVVDKDREILFTQLKSSTQEMKDQVYYYLLLIKNNPIYIQLDFDQATIKKCGNSNYFDHDKIKDIANEAHGVLLGNGQHIFR